MCPAPGAAMHHACAFQYVFDAGSMVTAVPSGRSSIIEPAGKPLRGLLTPKRVPRGPVITLMTIDPPGTIISRTSAPMAASAGSTGVAGTAPSRTCMRSV
jgi:hypothetical protein